MANNT